MHILLSKIKAPNGILLPGNGHVRQHGRYLPDSCCCKDSNVKPDNATGDAWKSSPEHVQIFLLVWEDDSTYLLSPEMLWFFEVNRGVQSLWRSFWGLFGEGQSLKDASHINWWDSLWCIWFFQCQCILLSQFSKKWRARTLCLIWLFSWIHCYGLHSGKASRLHLVLVLQQSWIYIRRCEMFSFNLHGETYP
jgi:hypothetical protein